MGIAAAVRVEVKLERDAVRQGVRRGAVELGRRLIGDKGGREGDDVSLV